MKFITRMQYNKCNGYMVRFQANLRIKSKFFNANKLGVREAKKAAVKWRDEHLLHHEPLNELNKPRTNIYNRERCTNPIIGVSLTQTNGGYFAWVARFSIGGSQQNKSYSIEKYGFDEAFQLACEKRYQMRGKLIVINSEMIPCLPDYPYEIKEYEPK